MTTDARPALERFIDAVQVAMMHTPNVTSAASLERFRRAADVARSIVLADNPIAGPGASVPLDRFIATETREADDVSRAAVETDAIYFVGLSVGLLLADRV